MKVFKIQFPIILYVFLVIFSSVQSHEESILESNIKIKERILKSEAKCTTGKEISEAALGTCVTTNRSSAGCSNKRCEKVICSEIGDPFCCNGIWDQNCVESAQVYCTSDALPRSTCFSHSTTEAGCNSDTCENIVCSLNSNCCTSSWGWDCVLTAIEQCCLEDFMEKEEESSDKDKKKAAMKSKAATDSPVKKPRKRYNNFKQKRHSHQAKPVRHNKKTTISTEVPETEVVTTSAPSIKISETVKFDNDKILQATRSPARNENEVPSKFVRDMPSVTISTSQPTSTPSIAAMTLAPSKVPTSIPSSSPTKGPTSSPSFTPTSMPSSEPSSIPSYVPTTSPTVSPTKVPTSTPSSTPSSSPSSSPSSTPSSSPSSTPSSSPSSSPTYSPPELYCTSASHLSPLVADCAEEHETTGCSNTQCEAEICNMDQYCCESKWDSNCAERARVYCLPLPKSTCFAKSSIETGCDKESCEQYVCAFNSLCCTSSWSWDCVLTAIQYCCLNDFDHFDIPQIDVDMEESELQPSASPTILTLNSANPTLELNLDVISPSNVTTIVNDTAINEEDIISIDPKIDQIATSSPTEILPDEESLEVYCTTGSNLAKDLGDCLSSSTSRGCSNSSCQEKVCSADSFCCNTIWDENCADNAKLICLRDELPKSSNCYLYSEVDTGCSNTMCQTIVCDLNPLCCTTSWSLSCVFTAIDYCCIESFDSN